MITQTEQDTLLDYSKDKELLAVQKEIPTIVERAQNFLITSNEQLEKGTEVSNWIRTKLKAIEDRRKFFTVPLNDHIKRINEFFKGLTNPLNQADDIIGNKMIRFRAEQREEAERKNRELQKKAEKKAEKQGIDPSTVIVETLPGPAKSVGAMKFKEVPDYEIVDPKKIPNEYWMVDEVKIGKAVRAGIKDIPGVRIFMKEIPSR